MSQKPTYEELEKRVKELERESLERKRVEESLSQEKNFSESIIDSLPGIVYFFDDTGQFIRWNKNLENVSSYSTEEISKMSPLDFFEGEDKNNIAERIQEAFIKGKSSAEADFVSKNGDKTPYYFSGELITIGKKKHVGGMGIDITERKQAEVELQRSEIRYRTLYQESMQREQLYESLLKFTPDAVIIYNLNGEVNYVNPAFTQIFDFSIEDVKGKRIPFVPEGEMEKTIAGIKQVLEGESVTGFETRRLTKDGRVLDISLSAACYDDHEGHRAGIVVFLRDVTEAKQTERQLQQAQRMEAIGTLAGGIAHDFNNLLMGIQGRSSLMLLDKDSSHSDFGHLKGIEDHVKSAADLTGQLLAFARGGKYAVSPTDLNKLVKNQNQMFGRTKKEIAIRGKYEENLWVAEVDRGQIEQVLLNLYVNAWQSMPGGGNLYIQTENVELDENYTSFFEVRPGKFIKISVADTGVGMDESTLQKIFDPFFTTREMGRGTGLGLASAYGIIKNHGGFIEVYSEKGQGAAFDIYLPASDKEVIAEVELSKDLLKGSGTVLLVDDEDMIIDVGKQILEQLGYKVLASKSGRDAIEIYTEKQAHIDLIILDMIMPDMGGGETYDKLKKINPQVIVMLASGYSIDGQATEILNRGCDGFIQKPFDIKNLSFKLNELLNKV